MTVQSNTLAKLRAHGIATIGFLELGALVERALNGNFDPEELDCIAGLCVVQHVSQARSSHQASETRTRLHRRAQRAESIIAQAHRRWMGAHGLRHQLRALARCEANCSPEVMHDAV